MKNNGKIIYFQKQNENLKLFWKNHGKSISKRKTGNCFEKTTQKWIPKISKKNNRTGTIF